MPQGAIENKLLANLQLYFSSLLLLGTESLQKLDKSH